MDSTVTKHVSRQFACQSLSAVQSPSLDKVMAYCPMKPPQRIRSRLSCVEPHQPSCADFRVSFDELCSAKTDVGRRYDPTPFNVQTRHAQD